MPEQEEFLTVAEVAAMLKLNQQTIRNWLDAGRLPYVRVGRRVRIKPSDFNQLIEQGYSGGPPASPPAPAGPSVWEGEVEPPDSPKS